MKKWTVQSPTRVDLAGGTLDMWPLFNFVGGAQTINLAISIFSQVQITDLDGERIELVAKDIALEKSYANLAECLKDKDPKIQLLQTQLEYWRPVGGLRLETSSQSPVGAGLGGSSSLTISLMRAFMQRGRNVHPQLKSVYEVVNASHNIEAYVLGTPTGTQDYFPAYSGGLNILTYSTDGVRQEVLPVDGSELEKHFLLVNTGRAHHSGINNFEVLSRAVHKDKKVLSALHQIREIADTTAEVCRKARWKELPGLFREEYKARVQLADSFSSPEIEKLHSLTLQAGAEALKICGAGGGGCVLVWVPPEHRSKVEEQCQKNGFQVLAAKPVSPITNP